MIDEVSEEKFRQSLNNFVAEENEENLLTEKT